MKRFFSILFIISLVCSVCLFGSGTAFAASGDASGDFGDFPFVTRNSNHQSLITTSSDLGRYTYVHYYNGYMYATGVFVLPAPTLSGSVRFSSTPRFISTSLDTPYKFRFVFCDSDGDTLSTYSWKSATADWNGIAIPDRTNFIIFEYQFTTSNASTDPYVAAFDTSCLTYSNVVYNNASGGADLSVVEDLLSYSDQIYTTYSGAYDWTQHQFASTSTWNDFGSAFQSLLYSNSGAAILLTQLMVGDSTNTYSLDGVTYNNLPAYLIALGNKVSSVYAAEANTQSLLTSRFNSVDGDLDVLQSNMTAVLAAVGDLRSGVSSALYADYPDDTDANKTSWSVAQWLRGIYDVVTSFFSSFWSPAEQDLKEANEAPMQELADSNMNVSASNVSDLGSVAPDVMSSLSTSVSPSSAFGLISDGSSPIFSFWSQECMDAMDTTGSGVGSLQSDDEPEPSFVDQNDAWRRQLLGGVIDD